MFTHKLLLIGGLTLAGSIALAQSNSETRTSVALPDICLLYTSDAADE